MNRILLVAIFTLIFCSNASALIISGDYQLSDGRNVNLSGLEWLDLNQTIMATRETVDSQAYEGYSDWRYATVSETEALLKSLWGGSIAGWHETNAEGSKWFIDHFGCSDVESGTAYISFYYGSESEMLSSGYDDRGSFHNEIISALDSGYINMTGTFAHNDISTDCFAGWMLVRGTATAPVPEPCTILLLGVGLAGLMGKRKIASRKIKSREQ